MFEPEELMARIVDLEAQLKESEMAPPAAEQLIACLEGEIAKRDARIVELENAAESLRISRDYHHDQEVEYRRRWAGLYAAPVSEAKAQGVVMPERETELFNAAYGAAVESGWESVKCMARQIWDAARLNAAPAAPAADAGMVAVEWAKDAEEWGPALNEAGWLFLSELNEDPQKSALIFNNTKGPLRAAIMKYAEIVAAHRAKGVV